MKKLFSIILTIVIVISLGANVFAAGTADTLTPAQKSAKDAFMATYYTQWQTLVELRVQTVKVLETNKDLRTQITTTAKSNSTLDKDSLVKIKATIQQNKDIHTQIKALDVQRKGLVTKWHAAVKVKDIKAMSSISDQIKAVSFQIAALKSQIASNYDAIKPLKDQVRIYRDTISKRKTTLAPIKLLEKAQHDKIVSEEKAKSELWVAYRTNITNKDYAGAQTTFQSIIDAKKQILQDIQANTANLNNILAAFNKA